MRFEDKLELELEAIVAENAAPTPTRRRFGWKPRVAVIGAVAAAATAIAVSGLVEPSSPAWAVEKAGDGVVRITINEMKDPEGLEKALAELDIRADITFVPYGKTCKDEVRDKRDPEAPITVDLGRLGHQGNVSVLQADAGNVFEIRYRPQRADQTAAILLGEGAARTEGGLWFLVSLRNVLGPVAPCELVDG